jgi:hypothetical protein
MRQICCPYAKEPIPHSSKMFMHKGRKEGRKKGAWGELSLLKNAE